MIKKYINKITVTPNGVWIGKHWWLPNYSVRYRTKLEAFIYWKILHQLYKKLK